MLLLGATAVDKIVGLADVQHRLDGVLLERGIPAVRVFQLQVTTADAAQSGPITPQTEGNAIDVSTFELSDMKIINKAVKLESSFRLHCLNIVSRNCHFEDWGLL